ncbi:MAG: TSUP family transporter [Campylobacteraceae bacterium]|nr:TSUP family transporter [Campylobacteraceae bacterium]
MEFEIWQIAILVAAGFIGGFIDAIAGGGGLICLPALMAVGVPAHAALATNKLQGSFGTLTATLNFTRKGYINFKEVYLGIIFTFLGAVLGTTLVLFIDAKFLNYIIPVLLIAIVIYTIFSPNLGEIEREAKLSQNAFFVIFGLTLGFYDGFFGPGAGSFWTFAFIGVLGLSMKNAVANTKVLNFTSNIVALAVFIAGGQVIWLIGILMGFAQVLGGYMGSNFVIKKDVKIIKKLFLLMVILTTLKIIYNTLS